jgi:hypothetical protein
MSFWAAILAIVALMYLLSFGPTVWLMDRKIAPASMSPLAAFVYAPIFHFSLAGPRPVREALRWYADLGAQRRQDPVFDDSTVY